MEYFTLALNSLVIRGEAINNTEKRKLLRTRLAIASVVTGSERWCRTRTKKTAINDDLSYLTVSLEAQAKLFIQEKIRNGEYDLVTSEMLTFEVNNCPVEIRRNVIMDFIEENSAVHVGPASTSTIQEMAKEIMTMGVK